MGFLDTIRSWLRPATNATVEVDHLSTNPPVSSDSTEISVALPVPPTITPVEESPLAMLAPPLPILPAKSSPSPDPVVEEKEDWSEFDRWLAERDAADEEKEYATNDDLMVSSDELAAIDSFVYDPDHAVTNYTPEDEDFDVSFDPRRFVGKSELEAEESWKNDLDTSWWEGEKERKKVADLEERKDAFLYDRDFGVMSKPYTSTYTSSYKYEPLPKWTSAGGVVLAGLTPDLIDQVFLVRPSNNFGPVSFPKGRVEGEISKEETAVREVLEESGLTARILPDSYLGCFEGTSSQTHYWMMLRTGGDTSRHDNETEEVYCMSISDAIAKLTNKRDIDVATKAKAYIDTIKARLFPIT